jgi:ABC-type nitrate/sulfonate/bicarbonate transport system permease component
MKRSKSIADCGAPLLFIALLLVLWELIVRWGKVPEWILPGPLQILKTFGETLPMMLKHARVTIFECLVGFAAAVILDDDSCLLLILYTFKIRTQVVKNSIPHL